MAQESSRIKIETLLNGGKHTPTEISRLLKVNRTTVYRVRKRLDAGVSIKHKQGSGRPGKICKSIKYSAAQIIKSDPEISLRKLANKLTEKKKMKVCKSTVHWTLRHLKYSKPFPTQIPLLSEKNRLFRIEWARKNMNKLWCRAVFADDASFW
ncbi:hypothetical protein LOD99_2219 [Oopsacas minuta]|uniref:Transposase Tc1-like domain-containing protein n=1 Tax=Oopsacas minuta TaxID=111878 RepID=A0AAV7K444_9METZ|nr:hypothetical protein LOD99_2219 [Oopsacas minuta]